MTTVQENGWGIAGLNTNDYMTSCFPTYMLCEQSCSNVRDVENVRGTRFSAGEAIRMSQDVSSFSELSLPLDNVSDYH